MSKAIFLAVKNLLILIIIFQALLNYEAIQESINVSDRYDNDPLHIAAMKGFLPICRVSNL